MRIGYARVSSDEQETTLQLDRFKEARCERVFQEKASAGHGHKRPMLLALLEHLRPGDVVIVWKVDRLARSLADLLAIIERIEGTGAALQSLTEPIDTSSPAGRMMMQMIGAFAEFERSIIRERSMAGQLAARRRGVKLGRKRAMSPGEEARAVQRVLEEGESMSAVARSYGCHLSSVKRAVLRVTRPESPAVAPRRVPVLR